jgi:vacuolar-type H+-ATPase subunit H
MDAVAFEDDLEAAQRDAERLRGDALVERARIIAEALREGERLAAGVRAEAAAKLAEAERDAEEWLTEAEQERERLLAEARGLAAELVGEAEEQAEAWLGEVDAERSRLEAEAEGVRTAARMQGAALLAAAGAVAAARLDDVDAQVRGLLALAERERDELLAEAGVEAERLVGTALERRGVIEVELDALRVRLDEARTALAELEERRKAATAVAPAEPVAPAPATGAVVELVPVLAARTASPRPRRRGRALGIAAAVAAAAVGAGTLGFVVGGDDAQARPDAVEEAYQDALGAPGSEPFALAAASGPDLDAVVTRAGDGYVDAGDLPALEDGRTYQLWADADGEAVPVTLLGRDPGVVRFTVPAGASSVTVTEEDDPGAATPGSDAVAEGDLSS